MVRGLEVGYFEFDVLCPEVMFCTKYDWEGDRANWCRRVSKNDAVEQSLAWSKQTHIVETHLFQCAYKDQIEPTSTVDEYSSKLGALNDWIEYKRELSRFREVGPLIFSGEGN